MADTLLRLVGDPGRQELLLHLELEAGIDGEADVLAGRALGDHVGRSRDGLATRIALRHGDPGRPTQDVLVVLLDAVLPQALAVDEPEEVGRQRRVGTAARLRVDPQGLRFEGDARDGPVARRGPDPVGHRRFDAAGEDDVRLVLLVDPGTKGGGRLFVQTEHPDQRVGGRTAFIAGHAVGRGHEPVARHGRRQDDGARPVVDLAAGGGLLDANGGLRGSLVDQEVALPHLPEGQSRDERERAHDDDEQEPDEAATRIRTTQHVGRSARREDDGVVQLAEAVIDGLLADGRLATEAVQVRVEILDLGVHPLAGDFEPADVVARGGDAHVLGQPEECQQERDDDAGEDESEAIGSTAGPDRGPGTSAPEGGTLDDAWAPGQADQSRAGALVDGHGQSPAEKRRRGLRGSRNANGSDGADGPQSVSSRSNPSCC